MKPFRLLHVLLFLCVAAQATAAQDRATRSERVQQQVEAIGLAAGVERRRAAIVDRIERMGLELSLHWFDPPPSVLGVDRRGANVRAQLPGNSRHLLLLGAHYDDFGRAQGVIDNAAGVAVVLELAEVLVENPMGNFNVAIVFFDLEEDGRLGSRAMVSDSLNNPLPDLFLNFDIFGYGDGMWVGAQNPRALLPRLMQEHGTAARLEVVIDSMYPSSDHMSYRNTRTESYGISLLDASDIHSLLARFRTRNPTVGETPRIFTIMHTTEDTMDKLDAQAVARGVEVVEQALRDLDAMWTGSNPVGALLPTGELSNERMQATEGAPCFQPRDRSRVSALGA